MRKYLFNIAWLGAERVVSIVGGLAITVYVARYLGPEKMGVFNFSLALIALIVPIAQLGSEPLIFNRVARNLKSGVCFLKSTVRIRFVLYLTLSFGVLLFCYFRGYTNDQLVVLVLMMISCLFSSQDIYRCFFDATLKSKFNTVATQSGLFFSLFLRVMLIKTHASYLWFALPFITNTFIPYFLRMNQFKKQTKGILAPKSARRIYSKYLLSAGVPLAASSMSVVIYTRVGQVILGEALNVKSVAIYNSAVTLGQGWNFIAMALITTLITKIVKDKKTIINGVSFIYFSCITIALPVILIYYFFCDEIIKYTYGMDYIEGSEILFLISISALFSVLGAASSRVIIALGGYRYLMWKTISMAIISVILSTSLIDLYGLRGAAYSLLIIEAISFTLGDYFFNKGILFKAQIAILNSYKYLKKLED